MRPNTKTVINALSATTSQASAAVDASFVLSASLQCISSSGSNSGTIALQMSNDPVSSLPSNEAPVNWSTFASATVSSGGIMAVHMPQGTFGGCRWIRALWTPTSGVGTITVNLNTLGM